jgi:hypothetical protein
MPERRQRMGLIEFTKVMLYLTAASGKEMSDEMAEVYFDLL